ncbi:syndecan-2-B-like isoform X1 [Lampetra planeri]
MRTSSSSRRLTFAIVAFSLLFQSVLPAEDDVFLEPQQEGSGNFSDDENSFDDDDTEGSASGEQRNGSISVVSKRPVTEAPSRVRLDNNLGYGRNAVELATSAPPPSLSSNIEKSNSQGQGFFDKTEVLAAVIAGGAVGILLAVLLVVLLVHRLKKKDAGSYALEQNKSYQAGYQKAPPQEIYA